MGEVIPFDFETNAVRVVMVGSEPWFAAADVCRVLEIANSRDAVSRLDDDEKGVAKADTLGGEQTLNIVSESGLYALIFRSNKPSAKRFRKWVTAEVLPAIRRDGFYFSASSDIAELAAKRAYFASLPESHQAMGYERAGMVQQVVDLIAQGWKVGEASRAVATQHGVSERTIYSARAMVRLVPRADWPAALGPHWAGPRGMLADCHPEAMQFWIGLVGSGARISDCYRRLCDVAAERGWAPIPCDRTMRRVADRLLPRDIPRPKKEKAA